APESRLRVKMQTHAREVFLDEGQAVFRVAKSADRPFFVKTGSTEVRAIGTTFGVENRGRGGVVTVVEGKVEVSITEQERSGEARSRPASSGHSSVPSSGAGSPVFLVAGQQVTIGGVGVSGTVHDVDAERALSWSSGRLVFTGDPVVAVIEQFNRY